MSIVTESKKTLKIKAVASAPQTQREVEKLSFDDLRLVYGGAEGGEGSGEQS